MSSAPEPSGGVNPHLMTVDQAAEYLNVSSRWLSEAVRGRRIRCTRLGRTIRFRLEYLEEFIASHEQPVTTSPSLRSLRSPRTSGARSRL